MKAGELQPERISGQHFTGCIFLGILNIFFYHIIRENPVKLQLYRHSGHTVPGLLFFAAVVIFFVHNLHFEPRKEEGAEVVRWHSPEELELLVKVENGACFFEGDTLEPGFPPHNTGQTGEGGQDTAAGTQEDVTKESFPALFTSGREVQKLPEGSKVCYLTFDDGPSENTLKVLEILRQYDAKATFFLIGENINEETAPIVQKILEEGHAVGLHANVHTYKSLYRSLDSFLSDYEKLFVRLRDEFGIETPLFRFPGGSACSYLHGNGKEFIRQMHSRGFSCYDWNVSGEDAVGKPTVSSIKKNVFRDVFRYNTPVVLLHDSAQTTKTLEALPEILLRISGEGYRFLSLAAAEEYIFPKNRE